MKRWFQWLILLSKRLYKRGAFLAVLALIPLAVLALQVAAQAKSGFIHVVLAQTDPADAISSSLVDRFMTERSLVLFTYADDPNLYSLYWQDLEYRHALYGKFDSLAQLLQMAESVNNQPGSPVDEPPKRIEKSYTPGYIPYGYTPVVSLIPRTFLLDYLDPSGEIKISFAQHVINSASYGDAEHGIASDIKICGFDGVVFRYTDYSNYYTLVWQDYEYKYVIDGLFESYEDAIRLAESVYE